MSEKLTKRAYAAAIAEDVEWLKSLGEWSLEADHIVLVLENSIHQYYPSPTAVEATDEQIEKAVARMDKVSGGFLHDGLLQDLARVALSKPERTG